jgi:hypothetical protein
VLYGYDEDLWMQQRVVRVQLGAVRVKKASVCVPKFLQACSTTLNAYNEGLKAYDETLNAFRQPQYACSEASNRQKNFGTPASRSLTLAARL